MMVVDKPLQLPSSQGGCLVKPNINASYILYIDIQFVAYCAFCEANA